MTKYDERRKNEVVKALLKAKAQAETALLYLCANDAPDDEMIPIGLALEHASIALEHLGIDEETTAVGGVLQ